jgi:carbamoyl-phosphate synthase large subunit
MNVAYDAGDLSRFLEMATDVSPHHPIVVTKFIQGAQELDVDAVASNGDLVVYSLAQHVENAGVHSGDATLVLPPLMNGDAPIGHERWGLHPISVSIVEDVKKITRKVAEAFQITGPFNMQLILERGEHGHSLKMIECNLRASRSFPFSSKVLEVNFIDLATRALVGHPSLEAAKPSGDLMLVHRPYKAVKVPVFSWTRLAGADPCLGVEMASTGEVACFGRDVKEAFLLAHISNHNNFADLPMAAGSSVVFSMDELTNLEEAVYVARKLHSLGYRLLVDVKKNQERLQLACTDLSLNLGLLVPSAPESESLVKVLQDRRSSKEAFEGVSLVLSLCQIRPRTQADVGYLVRRSAVDFGIGLLNEPKSAMLLADAIGDYLTGAKTKAESVRDWGSWIR